MGLTLLLWSTLAFGLDQAFQTLLVARGKELNSVYQTCLGKFAPNFKEQLRIAQRAWIVFDNKNEAAFAAVGKRRGMSEEDLDRAGLPETEARTEILRTYFTFPNEDVSALRQDLERAEQELTAVYKQCIATLDRDEEQKLRDAERAWIEYREKDMRAQAGDPSGRAPVWTSVRLARRRTVQLREFYLLRAAAAPTLAGAPSPAQTFSSQTVPAQTFSSQIVPAQTPPPTPATPRLDPAARAKLVADFRDATQQVLARADASGVLSEATNITGVKEIPAPLADDIAGLREKTAALRKNLDNDDRRDDCRADLETARELVTLQKSVQAIRAADAPAARAELALLREEIPAPGIAQAQSPLWKCLDSLWTVCNHLSDQAKPHLQRAKSASDAGRNGDAVKEYQEAYKIYPDPQTAQTIKRLREDSLGL